MLQEIAPYKFDNHYCDAKPSNISYVVAFRGNGYDKEVLIANSDEKNFKLPKACDFQKEDIEKMVYLFKIGEDEYFLYDDEFSNSIEGYEFYRFYDIRRNKNIPQHLIFGLYTAFHLNDWYSSSKYCGKCGSFTQNDEKERARICPKCGNKIYPRINPAVIIGVTDKETNKIILTKYRTGFAQNALVAGFTEIGETLEETVKREVMEEVGLKVDNIRYYKSQPWGIASDILSGFYCDVVGEKDITMDASELKYAEWVAPEDVVLQDPDYSLTNEMMRVFKEKGYAGTIK